MSAGEPPQWTVSCPGVKVRSTNNQYSAIITLLYQGTTVRGIEEGDWLKLHGEPGYIMIRRHNVEFLRRVDQTGGGTSRPSRGRAIGNCGGSREPSEDPSCEYTPSDSQSSSANLGAVDLKDLPPEVKDENGNLLSIGSARHASGKCKPCVFAPNCKHGVSCNFCHVDLHDESSYTKHKMRPCKGKRETYKNLVRRAFTQIEQNPDTFDVEALELPGSVGCNPRVKDKFMKRVNQKLQFESGTSSSSECSAQEPGQPSRAPAPAAPECKRNLMSL